MAKREINILIDKESDDWLIASPEWFKAKDTKSFKNIGIFCIDWVNNKNQIIYLFDSVLKKEYLSSAKTDNRFDEICEVGFLKITDKGYIIKDNDKKLSLMSIYNSLEWIKANFK
jgi:hypothetical protein